MKKTLLLGLLFLLIINIIHAQENSIEILGESTRVVLNESPKTNSAGSSAMDKKISLDLRGVDVVEVLKFLALRAEVNIIPSKGVSGRVSLFLKDVTIEEALDIILVSNGLAYVKEKNILNVMTEAEYMALYGDIYRDKKLMKVVQLKYAAPAQIQQALAVLKSNVGKTIIDASTGTIILIDTPDKLKVMSDMIALLDQPPVTKVFSLKYGSVKELEAKISAIATPGVTQIQSDERTQKIIVTDLPKKMERIEQLINEFDEKSREVLIEARIIQVVLNNQHQSGIKWNYVASPASGRSHKIEFINDFANTSAGNVLSLSKAESYNATLQLLNSMGDTKVLSSPRITTLNGKEAKILVGTREAYVTLSNSSGTAVTTSQQTESVQFIEVGVKLYVTPIINANDFVTMKIRPEVSSVTSTITSPLGSKIPIIGTTEAETSVMIKNGITLIIGGLMKDEKIKTKAGIPFLSKLPFLGALFRNSSEEIKKTELIVFLTPHIVTGEKNVMSLEGDVKDLGEEMKSLESDMKAIEGAEEQKMPKGKMKIE